LCPTPCPSEGHLCHHHHSGKLSSNKNVRHVTANITKRIYPLLELIEEVMDTMQGVMTEVRKAANMLYSTCEDIRDKIHKEAKCEGGAAEGGIRG